MPLVIPSVSITKITGEFVNIDIAELSSDPEILIPSYKPLLPSIKFILAFFLLKKLLISLFDCVLKSKL